MNTRHRSSSPGSRTRPSRRGVLAPIIAVALMLAMACIALVTNRMWMESARVELQAASEAAALAAAARLVSDDLLRTGGLNDPTAAAEQTACSVAALNLAAGFPVELNVNGETGDVRFGVVRIPEETGRPLFLETTSNPRSVAVFARRAESGDNPVGMFIAGVTGLPWGDVSTHAEATLSGEVSGVGPLPGSYAPVLPLALLESTTTETQPITWSSCITARMGPDTMGWDDSVQQVTPGPDGIPEMVLLTRSLTQATNDPPNVAVCDWGSAFEDATVTRQIHQGLNRDDLETWGRRLPLPVRKDLELNTQLLNTLGGTSLMDAALGALANAASSLPVVGSPITIPGAFDLQTSERDALDAVIGQPRIAVLYRSTAATSAASAASSSTAPVPSAAITPPVLPIQVVSLVGIRVLNVLDLPDGRCQVTVQPAVVVTRTAIVSDRQIYAPEIEPSYIYRLQLTN